MSAEGNAAPGAASNAADQAPPAPPLIAPTGHAKLDVLVGDLNATAAPFQSLSDKDATTLDKANAVIGGTLNAVMTPLTLLNDGFAQLTADIAKVFPPLPAATLGSLHIGIPHVHVHPPAMPIPLPSLGPVALAGCVSVLINGIPAARAGDLGLSVLCGTFSPPFEIMTGSSKVFIGGARAARAPEITLHCMPGAAAGKAMSGLEKVVQRGGLALGVMGVGAEGLQAVTDADKARRLREKKVEPKAVKVDPVHVSLLLSVHDEDPAEVAKEQAQADAEATAAAQKAADEQAAADAAFEQQMIDDQAEAASAAAKTTGIQTGLDAAAMALGLIMGLDPGTPPCIGSLIPMQFNVLIGGFPMPPWSAVAKGLGKLPRLKSGIKKLQQKFKCDRPGEPIDPVTGASVSEGIDYEETGPLPFRWGRSYTSARADHDGPMGRGFRHSYEHTLTIDLDRVVYTDPEGREVELPIPVPEEPETFRGGYGLRSRVEKDHATYEVTRKGAPTMEFVRERRYGAAPRLSRLLTPSAQVELVYDALGRMTGMIEIAKGREIETWLIHDDRGHLLEVRRGPRGAGTPPLVASYGYDHAGCLTVFQDALGNKGSYAYDAAGRMVRKTDRNGYSFHFAYDEQGRCVEERGEDGLWSVAMRYEPEQRRTFVREPDGAEWTYAYDENDTVILIQDPYGARVERTLDEEGKVVRQVGPGARDLTFLYDETGRHDALVDGFGERHPPLDEMPDPPDPLQQGVPATALEQQWGAALQRLPVVASALMASGPRPAVEPRAPSQRSDALGRVVEEVDPDGHRLSRTYDPNGNVVRYLDRDGSEHRTVIDSWNLVGAEVDPLGHSTRYDYTARARIARVVDPAGNESRYEYDQRDRLVRVSRHGVAREEYSYDDNDRVIEKRDGAGNVLLRRSIGRNGLLSVRRLASGEVHRFEYDARGQVTRASPNEVEVRRAFDRHGRLILDERDSRGIQHQFAGQDLRETTYFGRFSVTYRRASDGSLSIQGPVGGVHRIRRGQGGSVFTELGNGTSAWASYDEQKRCQARELRRPRRGKTALWSVRYAYSAEGELRRTVDNARGTTEYTYDAAHRLTGELGPSGVMTPIVLDPAGNLLEKSGLQRAELLEGNRLRAAGGERFRYDARNHLTEQGTADGGTTRYSYDSLDMLVGVAWSGRDEVWTAGYDGLRRRLYKALGAKRTDFYWDGDRLAAEVGPTGALRIYIYPGPDALVPLLFLDYDSVDAPPESGRAYYPIGNQIGAPLHIENQAGEVVWWASHVDPYGAITLHPGASIAYAMRFPGHYLDEETGLHYNRYRYYSPRLGRYLQSDPAGQAGGINLYAYPANPLVDVDVFGLTGCGCLSWLPKMNPFRRRETHESESVPTPGNAPYEPITQEPERAPSPEVRTEVAPTHQALHEQVASDITAGSTARLDHLAAQRTQSDGVTNCLNFSANLLVKLGLSANKSVEVKTPSMTASELADGKIVNFSLESEPSSLNHIFNVYFKGDDAYLLQHWLDKEVTVVKKFSKQELVDNMNALHDGEHGVAAYEHLFGVNPVELRKDELLAEAKTNDDAAADERADGNEDDAKEYENDAQELRDRAENVRIEGNWLNYYRQTPYG